MANVKKGALATARERWKHLKPFLKRDFWSRERQAHERAIDAEVADTWRRRGIDRRPFINEAGDTVWPDSEAPNDQLEPLPQAVGSKRQFGL